MNKTQPELALTAKVHYKRERVRGRVLLEEIYLVEKIPRILQLSPNYVVRPCSQEKFNYVAKNWRFREFELPLNLLEGIILDIDKFRKMDTVFDMNHDRTVLPRIDQYKAKIRTEIKKVFGYL